jgi:hypothetical protein
MKTLQTSAMEETNSELENEEKFTRRIGFEFPE